MFLIICESDSYIACLAVDEVVSCSCTGQIYYNYILSYVPVNMESVHVLKYTSLGKKLSRAVKSGVHEVSLSELHSDVNLV